MTPGDVDEGVDRPVDLTAEPVERARVGEVGHQHLRAGEGVRQLAGAGLAAREQDELVAAVRQAVRQGEPDARAGTGEDVLHRELR